MSTTFTTKADADAWLAAQVTDAARGVWVDPRAGSVTLREYAEPWLERRHDLSPRTRELYQSLLDRHILPRLGDVEMGRLRPNSVRAWHAAIAGHHPNTAAKAYRLLATICATAVTDEVIVRSPCRVAGAGWERSPERPVASIAEVAALAAAMPEHLRLAVLLAAWCGLRRGEILGLRRGDIDVLHRRLTIAQTLQQLNDATIVFGPPKTAAGRRTIAVPSNMMAAMKRHLDRFVGPAPDSLVVTGEKGGPLRPQVLQMAWATARRTVGRTDLHFHDLRHSGNTWAATTGASTRELMARMGHASPAAALRYQHSTADRDQAIADALAQLERRANVSARRMSRARRGR